MKVDNFINLIDIIYMWWKIYFWIFAVINLIGIFGLLQFTPLNKPGDMLGIFLSIVLFLGIYAFVFKKKIFSQKIWKVAFVIVIVALIESILEIYILPKDFSKKYLSVFEMSISTSAGAGIFTWLISIPAVYAIYQLAYKSVVRSSSKVSKKSKKK
ncbi:MAG: hypothetical protein Q7R53_01945 [bacterium]|nr:hypothetical protein [bacterium]